MSAIGLDLGTSRVKAVRFDDRLVQADVAACSTHVQALPGGRREQDPEQVWRSAAAVMAEVAGRSPDPVELVAVTAQGDGCWLVDGAGAPTAPALLWNDNRAADVAARWVADGVAAEAFRLSGCMVAPGVANSQLRWLRDHRPEVVARSAHLLSCGSWVFSRLTGRVVVEASDAANPFCDTRTGRHDERLLELFDLTDLRRLLPPVVSGADAVAPLADEVARVVGLAPGTPVVLAPYDVPATALGAGVVSPGDAFAVLGTTLGVGVVGEDPHLDRTPGGLTLPTLTPGQWLVAYATLTGTEALDWAARLLDLEDAAAVVSLASTSERSDAPLFAPYLSPAGERAPFLDPDVRGSLTGLDLTHSPADVARAVVEGLTLAVLDCLRATGPATSLVLCGGGARSDHWRQLIADAVGTPVGRPAASEVGALGAVLAGRLALGLDDLDDLRGHGRHVDVLEPRPAEHDRLQERYADLLALRDALG